MRLLKGENVGTTEIQKLEAELAQLFSDRRELLAMCDDENSDDGIYSSSPFILFPL